MALTAGFFYLFAVLAVVAGVMVIVAKNPVHAVLFLILAFFNAAGLFVLLGAEFLAMLLVIVYVGAVAVLFLFVVMMLDVDFAELKAGFIKNAPVGLLVGGIVLAELVLLFVGRGFGLGVAHAPGAAMAQPARDVSNTQALGLVLYTQYVYFFEGAGLDPARRHDRRHRADAAAQGRASSASRSPRRWRAARRPASRSSRCRRGGVDHSRRRGARLSGSRGSMTIGIGHYLTVAACLFTLGMFGIFLNRKNVIVILMSIELMLLAVNINLVAFSLLPRRPRRAGVRAVHPDGRRGRGRHRARDRRRLLPQPRLDRGRRHQHDEGLRRVMIYSAIVFLPLARRAHRGPVRPRCSAPRPSELITTGAADRLLRAVVDRVLARRLRARDARTSRSSAGSPRASSTSPGRFKIDTLTAVMLVVVTTVSALVHLYSIGYMHEDDLAAALLRLSVAASPSPC